MRDKERGRESGLDPCRLRDLERILQHLWVSASSSEKSDMNPSLQDYYKDGLHRQLNESIQHDSYVSNFHLHHFDDKGSYRQSYGFSSSHIWMWELDHKEGWALKNGCFWNVVWRRLSRVPRSARRLNQSFQPWIFIGRSVAEIQHFGQRMWTADSLEKTLMMGKIEGKRRKGWHRMSWLDSVNNWMDMKLSKLWDTVEDRGAS